MNTNSAIFGPQSQQQTPPQTEALTSLTPIEETPPPAPEQNGIPVPVAVDAPTRMRIGDKLVQLGLISQDQLAVALTEQRNAKDKKLIGQILVEMGFITESALGEVLAETSGTQKFDPKSTMLDVDVVRRIPKEVAMRHKVIPVSFDEETVQLAMADVYNVLAIDQVRRHFPRTVRIVPVYCTETEIMELIDQYFVYEVQIDGILREIESGHRDSSALDGREQGYVNPMVRLVNAILVDSVKQGASDIHLEPEGAFLRIRYRIDGEMTQIRSLHRDYWPAILVRIKILAGMNIAETRQPQDGRISFTAQGREVDLRVATQPTVHGENVVMRLLDKMKSLRPIDQIGYSQENIAILKKLIMRPEGIIIVTGPTGSGKTTTLYSVLGYINDISVNIMTLEDPVEYMIPLIRQSNVREGSMDFLSGVKSMMRQDPDIIFIGEVRDNETAQMAMRAALTGHQVYTTLHTNDALGVVARLTDIGVPPYMLAGALIGVVAQRLCRKLCQDCRVPKTATPEECKLLGVSADNPPVIHEPAQGGCEKCNKRGHKGRTAVVEILRMDKKLDELIATGATKQAMLDHALSQGFVTMAQDGINKVLAGELDLHELMGVADLTDRL